jgi:hypothetical protein
VDAQANPYRSPAPPAPRETLVVDVPEAIWIPRVASGLTTIAVGAVLILSASVLRSTLQSQVPITTLRLYEAAYFMIAAAAIWIAVGLFSCIATPTAIAPSRWIRWSIILALIDAGLDVGRLVSLEVFREALPWLSFLSSLATTALFVVLGLYFGRVSRFVSTSAHARLARIATALIVFWAIAQCIYFICFLNLPAMRGSPIAGVVIVGMHLCYWPALALYAGLCFGLRSSLIKRMEHDVSTPTKEHSNRDSNGTSWLSTPSVSRSRVTKGLIASWFAVIILLIAVAIPTIPWMAPELGWPSVGVFLALTITVAVVDSLKLAGALSGLATPDESGARTPVQIAAGAALLALFLRTSALLADRGILPTTELPVGASASLLEAAWAVAYLVYLRRLSRFIGRPELPGWFLPLLIGMIAMAVIDLPFAARVVRVPRSNFVYYCVAAVRALRFYGEFLVYIFYASQIWRVRAAIARGK